MAEYNLPILSSLIDSIAALPGIGKKSAVRLAFYILNMSDKEAEKFIDSIALARDKLHFCSKCQNLTADELCSVCIDKKRDSSIICVVESPQDVMAIEKIHNYNGVYHVLHGAISPLDNIGPDQIKIKELIFRITNEDIREVIIATNSSVEGETTSSYISKLIKPFGVKVTRIAKGIPVNGTLEFADSVTLTKALEGRTEL